MRKGIIFILACALAGAQEVKRPGADAGSSLSGGCAGTSTTSSAMPKSWDASGLATQSTQDVAGQEHCHAAGEFTSCTVTRLRASRLFSAWTAAGSVYSSLNLKINSAAGADGTSAKSCIQYSVDGGLTFTSLRCTGLGTGWTQTTDTIALSPTQDLTKLQVLGCASAGGRGGLSDDVEIDSSDLTIWDIWTVSNEAPPPAGGPGNTRGAPGLIEPN